MTKYTKIECHGVFGDPEKGVVELEQSEVLTGGLWLAVSDDAGGAEAHLSKDEARKLFLALAAYMHQMGGTP